MKKVYLIGGTMGIGKTTISQCLKRKLNNSVFLDGDWCWDAHPFVVNEETKKMVIENICFMLNQFIHCNAYENIIFCWVMHEQSIIDTIISRLDKTECCIITISLVCNEEELKKRLMKDVNEGIRNYAILEKSIKRIPLYDQLDTVKINVDKKNPQEIVEEIIKLK